MLVGKKPSSNGTKVLGLSNSQIAFFNPTKEELNDNGIMIQKDPEYDGVDIYNDGNKFQILSFWLKDSIQIGDTTKEIFNNLRISVSNRIEYLGKERQTVRIMNAEFKDAIRSIGAGKKYSTVEEAITAMQNNPNMGWFTNASPLYAAREGELMMYKFMTRWLNLEPNVLFEALDFDSIAEGEVTIFKDTVNNPVNADCRVRVLFYINDSGYPTVYNQEFWKGGTLTDRAYDYIADFVMKESQDGNQYNLPRGTYTTPNGLSIPRTLIEYRESDYGSDFKISDIKDTPAVIQTDNSELPF